MPRMYRLLRVQLRVADLGDATTRERHSMYTLIRNGIAPSAIIAIEKLAANHIKYSTDTKRSVLFYIFDHVSVRAALSQLALYVSL